jgi:hypothetical protein
VIIDPASKAFPAGAVNDQGLRRHAPINDADAKAIADYLAKTYGGSH